MLSAKTVRACRLHLKKQMGADGQQYEAGPLFDVSAEQATRFRAVLQDANTYDFASAKGCDPIFGVGVAPECPGVPRERRTPRSVWTAASAYARAARPQAALFRENFKKYESGVSAEIKAAGPA